MDSGNIHDNQAILMRAVAAARAGNPAKALTDLVKLRDRVVNGNDLKSKMWLLQEIDRAIDEVHTLCRTDQMPAVASDDAARSQRVHEIERGVLQWAAVGLLVLTILRIFWHDLSLYWK